MKELNLIPINSFLLRAYLDWIEENGLTPHLVVDATLKDVDVPQQFVENGVIILNIRPQAVGDLEITNEYVSFTARFGGKPTSVYVPINAVVSIFAKEHGIGFSLPDMKPVEPEPEKNKPTLSIV